ncbi:ABC transporter permease [Actinophytocola sp.]|uniref:ABC transporter permease n=1 Tax=Actinophytocola sp. TaxID=1872138 RepID=UPI002D3044BE|nr:ABC transporter permease [Actinophytocola sp.]HYQ64385.1 ABC transporter permease [Actinophytocola sp.]
MRWAFADGWTMTRRDILHWSRQPGPVIVGLLFPVLMVVMFGYLFGGAMAVPGGGDGYREFILPGMFAMTMAFGLEATMIAVTADAAKGVTDRFRSMPMAPSAVVTGRAGADMLNSVLGLVVIMLAGLLVGWRAHTGPLSVLAAVGLLLLLRFALLWLGIFLGLVIKGPESVLAVQILVWPVTFLSNTFVAPGTMPGWLGTIAEWNPLSSTVAATRHLFGNPSWGGGSWLTEHATPMAVAWPVLLIAIFFPLSVRRFQRLSR